MRSKIKKLKPKGDLLKRLRKQSQRRALEWRKGAPEAPTSFNAIELFGEVGELCNAIKKLLRHEMGFVGGSPDTTNLEEEIGDVAICLDLLAVRYNIDLGKAITKKFNKTSEKHGFKTRL